MNKKIVPNKIHGGGAFNSLNTTSFCVPQIIDLKMNLKMEFFIIPSFCVEVN